MMDSLRIGSPGLLTAHLPRSAALMPGVRPFEPTPAAYLP